MKNLNAKSRFFLLMIIGLGAGLFSVRTAAQQSVLSAEPPDNQTIPSGCTVFTIAKGDSVFFGGNDDYINPDSYYWVDPGDSTKYGVIWIGTPDNVQQGVSEKGLAYDANGLPRVNVNPHPERIPVSGGYSGYPIRIMHECSTVEEVITWINVHQWHSYMHDQMQFADATGDAVIISAGKDGEVAFTRKPSGDGFLVSTNFNVANTSNSYGYPCWRYDKVQELAGQMLNKTEQLTAKDAISILEAVHVEKGSSWTIESMVADLVNGVVYLYYYYQYDSPIVLNVKDELSNPREAGPFSKLFPDDIQKEAGRRYNLAQATTRINKIVGITWIVIILVSLILLFAISADNKRGFRFWVPAVVILGPFALLVRLMVLQNQKAAIWKTALVETVGDLLPAVAAFTVALIVLILIMISRSVGWQLQVVLMLGLPLFASWLIFHGPLLSPLNKGSFGKFLIRRLPQVLVSTLLGLAGIFTIEMPLVNQRLNMVHLLPLFLTCWAIVVLGALAGGFLIFLYEYWAVKQNFQAWSILAGNEGQVNTPSWRKLWWWILLSFVILLLGLIAGIMIQKILAG